MGKSPKKLKTAQKAQQQPVDMMHLYSRLNELSKEELIILKQQLIDQQKINNRASAHQQYHSGSGGNQQAAGNLNQNENLTEIKSKSKKRKKDQNSNNPINISNILINNEESLNGKKNHGVNSENVNSNVSSTKNSQTVANQNPYFNGNNHHIESVNLYLQASTAGKKIKKTIKAQQMKKKRNQDLADVCNESTILGKSKDDLDDNTLNSAKLINQDHLDYDEFNQIEDGNNDNNQQQLNSKMIFAISNNQPLPTVIEDQERQKKIQIFKNHEEIKIDKKNNKAISSSIKNPSYYQSNTQTSLNSKLLANDQIKQSVKDSKKEKSKSNQRYDSNQSASTNSKQINNSVASTSQRQNNLNGTQSSQNNILNSKKNLSQDLFNEPQTNLYQNAQSSQRLQDGYKNIYQNIEQLEKVQMTEKQFTNRILQSKSIDNTSMGNIHKKAQKNSLNLGIKITDSEQKTKQLESKISPKKFSNLRFDDDQAEELEKVKEEIIEYTMATVIEDKSRQPNGSNEIDLEDTQYLLNFQLQEQKQQNKKTLIIQEGQQNHTSQDKLPLLPNSTKATNDIIQLQQTPIVNAQQTQPNFYQVSNNLLKKGKPKQDQQAQALVPVKKQKLDSIICLALSVEPYLKRNMQKLGWIDTINPSQFHIRFDITDKEGSQNKLRSTQWYNHFPNNRELTTKAGLCKNLWQQCPYDYELKVANFFPRCYDLSDSKQVDLFVLDFQQTALLSIIKMHAIFFLNKSKKINKYLQKYRDKEQFNIQKTYKRNLKLECSKYDQMVSGAGSMLGNDSLRLSMLYAKQHILQKQKIDRKEKSYIRKFTEEEILQLVEQSYSLAVGEDFINSKFPLYDQIKTIIYHEKLQQYLPQYKDIDGTFNVWVVKPSYNARGLGVYCANRLKDIIQQGKKSQSKIVQKYIENPYLVNRKKFDIRQWVLVTSWEPLDVYVFQSAYLKICGSEYSLQNLQDQFRHLSNFTIQKTNKQAGQPDEFVMSDDQFQTYIQQDEQGKYKQFSWQNDLFPKISNAVYNTLKGVQDSLEQRSNTFEIYGFDLILDENLNPWVIEVNLSPACNERTEYLTQMLDDMSIDLLQYLENKIIVQNNIEGEWLSNFKEKRELLLKKQNSLSQSLNLNEEQFYSENNVKYRWIRIQECIADYKNYQISLNILNGFQQQKNFQQPMELAGQKINLNAEKKIDKQFQKVRALKTIQKIYRGYKARKIYKRLLQGSKSIVIQSYLRQNLAKRLVFKLKQNKCAILIQKYLRKQIAQNNVKIKIKEKIHNAQAFVALKLQSNYRRKKAYKYYTQILKQDKATKIKKYLRKFQSKKKVKVLMKYKCMVIRIQKFYKKRFNKRKFKAITVQKYLRASLKRYLVKSYKKINKGSMKLLQIYKARKQQSAFRNLLINCKSIMIQSLVKMFLQKRKYQLQLREKAQNKIQNLFKKHIIIQIKLTAILFKQQMNQQSQFIQKYLRRRIAQNKIKTIKLQNKQIEKAKVIQKYLRGYFVWNVVQFRLKQIQSILKIQGFFRMLLAKKKFQRLKKVKTKRDSIRQKEIEKKFQKTNRIEKDIENYIESLFHREISQQNKMQQILSQTPGSKRTQLNSQQSRENLQVRQSFTSKTNGDRRTDQASNEYISSQTTTASQLQRIARESDQRVQMAINLSEKSQNQITKQNNNFQEYSDSNGEYQENEILATSIIMDDQPPSLNQRGNTVERQQKQVKVRKQKKASVQQPLNNLVTNKGTKYYQKDFNQRMTNALNRVQTNSTQHSQRTASIVPIGNKQVQSSNVPKPKTFAESLMNMLALQNIGQAFSENPVEALGILKQDSKEDKINRIGARKNSNASKGADSNNQSFINTKTKISQENQSAGITLENQQSKTIQFPKLNEFKSATNNIYLANRPIADPRADSEFQYQMIEQKLRKNQGSQLYI